MSCLEMIHLKDKLEVSENMKDTEGNSESFNVDLILSFPTKNATGEMILLAPYSAFSETTMVVVVMVGAGEPCYNLGRVEV